MEENEKRRIEEMVMEQELMKENKIINQESAKEAVDTIFSNVTTKFKKAPKLTISPETEPEEFIQR